MLRIICLVSLFCALAAGAARAAGVTVEYPTPKAFQLLGETETMLGRLAGAGNQAAGTLQPEAAPLRGKLQRLKSAADAFLGRELDDGDAGAVSAHNAECAAAGADLAGFYRKALALMWPAGLQVPSAMKQVAQQLVDSKNYEPLDDGSTQCNRFLDAYAQSAYGYGGFKDTTANGIVEMMRGSEEWKAVHDSKTGKGERISLQERLGAAQRYANSGYMVVIGLKTGPADAAGGHVAVVMPGELAPSGNWEEAGLPKMLPQIAQAGESTFSGKHLGFGISPEKLAGHEFVIYVRKPGGS